MTLDDLEGKLRSLPKEGDAIIAAAAAEKRKLTDEEQIRMDEIVEAHRFMEENRAEGKLVVITA